MRTEKTGTDNPFPNDFKLKVTNMTTQISFRCYAANEEKSYLIFEDLSAIGFRIVDRCSALDVAHHKLVLSKLAKYHAATAVLVEKVSFKQ